MTGSLKKPVSNTPQPSLEGRLAGWACVKPSMPCIQWAPKEIQWFSFCVFYLSCWFFNLTPTWEAKWPCSFFSRLIKEIQPSGSQPPSELYRIPSQDSSVWIFSLLWLCVLLDEMVWVSFQQRGIIPTSEGLWDGRAEVAFVITGHSLCWGIKRVTRPHPPAFPFLCWSPNPHTSGCDHDRVCR